MRRNRPHDQGGRQCGTTKDELQSHRHGAAPFEGKKGVWGVEVISTTPSIMRINDGPGSPVGRHNLLDVILCSSVSTHPERFGL